jgi:hypothetical protein
MTMPLYVIVPTNDRGKSVSWITVRTPPVTNTYIAGPKRYCAMIDADLSLDSALSIARWAIANLSLEHIRELRDRASERLGEVQVQAGHQD